jgi:quinoprotein glucose dehydrogenase
MGMPGAIPSLIGVTDRIELEGFRTLIQLGRNAMSPIPAATDEEIAAMYEWLEMTNPTRSSSNVARGGRAASLPPGPVVGRGGAPRPPLPPRYGGPFYPGVGGTAGNLQWPPDVAAYRLPTRYQTGHNLMGSATRPPYTTITAYDLNTGEIKWQAPNGDDPQTVEMTTEVPGQPCRAAGGCVPGGVRNTGGTGARYGMVVTKSGLLFQLSKDGFARAYDVDTGEVLWKGPVASGRIGIPVLYESKGRAYVLFMSPAPGGGNAPAGPHGYIAFALPNP